MAITDQQLHDLTAIAKRDGADCGRRDVGESYDESMILGRIFDLARRNDMRTLDEFNELVTLEDLPDPEDKSDLVTAWWRNWAIGRGFAATFGAREGATLT